MDHDTEAEFFHKKEEILEVLRKERCDMVWDKVSQLCGSDHRRVQADVGTGLRRLLSEISGRFLDKMVEVKKEVKVEI